MSERERQEIKALLQAPQWKAAEGIAQQLCDKIAYQSKMRNTEWDTISATLLDEGKVQGIKDFIKELYNAAQNA